MRQPGLWATLWAFWRFVRSRQSGVSTKVFLLLALMYVLVPADLVPDVLPLVGWLDDLGMITLVLSWASRLFRRSRQQSEASQGTGDAASLGATNS